MTQQILPMTLSPNPDGTMTVGFGTPSVTWNTSNGLLVPSNAGIHAGGSGQVASGNLPIWPLDHNALPYVGHIGLHLQYGADPTQVITDYFVPVTLQSKLDSNGRVNSLTHPGGNLSYTLTRTQLNDARASNGIYALGYLDIVWGPLYNQGSPITSSGWTELEFAVGANVITAQAQPPAAPTNVQGTINTDLSVTLSWNQSIPGTVPLAGYSVLWSQTTGGPYSGRQDFPISAYPPANSPIFTATVGASNFAKDGLTRYFVVEAFDNGSSPDNPGFASATNIVYFPTPPAIKPVPYYGGGNFPIQGPGKTPEGNGGGTNLGGSVLSQQP